MKFKFTNSLVFVIVLLVLIGELAGQGTATKPTNAQRNSDYELLGAAAKGDVVAAKRELDAGANVNAQNVDGKTPLMIAAQSVNYDMIKLLSDHGASFVYQDGIGWDAADWFDFGHKGLGTGAENKLSPIFRQKAEPEVKLARDLMNALAAGNTALAKQLIEQKAYVDFKDKRSKLEPTPLIVATDKGNIEAVKLLLARGPRVDRTDSQGRTPLYFAVGRGNLELVKLLVAAGADPNKKAANGKTSLDLARAANNTEMISELNRASDVFAARFLADAEQLELDWKKFDIEIKKILEKPSMNASTPKKPRSANDQKLIDVITKGTTDGQAVPDHIQEIQALLQKGADPNTTTDQGQTPLMIAVINKNVSALLVLLQAKASVDVQDANGFTALMHAVETDQFTAVGKLLDGGANKSLKDNKGRTAYDIAAEKKGTVMTLSGRRLKP